MSLFNVRHKADRYGVILDIGSGSVLAAIVHSVSKENHPHIVWAHREHAPLRNIDSLEQSAKAVMTALVNATMLLDAEGRKALHDYDSSAKLTTIQCGIAAPWSYTVTKTINYKQAEPFEVTEDLINELTNTINEKVAGELKENELTLDLGLQVITKANLGILTNGYRVANPFEEEALELAISQASVVSQQYLIDALDEVKDKLFANTELTRLSFILMLYTVVRDLLPRTYDACLIDITYEATEIGIIRDGILSYCTHAPFGSFSLAREIAQATGVPLHEAFGYLHTDKPLSFMRSLTERQRDEVETIFDAYIDRVSKLFKETGDELSIPKQIAIHADLKSEPLFTELIEKATKRAIKTEPIVTTVSSEIIKHHYRPSKSGEQMKLPSDTAMLLSAEFFHMQPRDKDFQYL